MIDLQATPTPSSWKGVLELDYDQDGVGVASRYENRTRLRAAYAQSPLKVQRSFYPDSTGTCHTVIFHTAGGMVGGDRLSYKLRLASETSVLVTTAAASKIYRSNGLAAEQYIEIQIDPGACLEWLPQETIVFEGAQFQQFLKVMLEPGASWIGWDIYRLGRTARNESFTTGHWRSHCEIWQGTQPIWIDRQFYQATPERWLQLHGLNGCPVIGTLIWAGTAVTPTFIEELRQLNFSGLSQAELGITRLERGMVCRYRGASTAQARDWLMQIWNHVRCFSLGNSACPPRVWQL